ncbi:hypothetical protein [Enterococcus sp. BWR-S5]|uniref:hypothetical protein n=1 Tax=Enterococcus sp. BWR-S5 TaxID=2787714 RepID=UPI001924D2DC|nr:hypothetical protein [Enterococcus sp. BWR-S5]MBL1227130.1 hypothetical protein [Enterococcus sp. BWR-S5]
MLDENLEQEIEEFVDDCLNSETTLYEALQLEDAISNFSLHFAMKEDDDILEKVMYRYFVKLKKNRELEFYNH